MKSIVALTREYVYRESKKNTNKFGMNAYDHHFKSVVKYARILAKECHADTEVVLVAAWLHDIGSIEGYYEDHHIQGQRFAEEFLKKQSYPQEKIDRVKHCIYAHRGSKTIKRETIEAQCVCDADSMSHFNTIDSLFYLAIKIHNLEAEAANTFVKDKLARSYRKLSPTGKRIIAGKYLAAMELLTK